MASADCGRGPPREKKIGGPSTRQDAYQDGPKRGKSWSSEVRPIGEGGPCGDLKGGVNAVGRHRFGMGWPGTSVLGSNNHIRENHWGGIAARGTVPTTHILLHSC